MKPSYTFRFPLRAVWSRYKRLFGGRLDLSVLRSLEYELLDDLNLSGQLLDFGGGENANYREHAKKWARNCTYDSVNIDGKIRPTYLISPGQPLPIATNSYDHALALNTLEHVYEVEDALREILRVLKPGATLIATVPFLFRIHGHPDDFLRCTPSWWGRTLEKIGYTDVVITPILWGPFSSGLSIAGAPGPFKSARMKLALILDIVYLHWASRRDRQACLSGPIGESLCNSPLGFLIEASKPTTMRAN